jgi:hypothetical protein
MCIQILSVGIGRAKTLAGNPYNRFGDHKGSNALLWSRTPITSGPKGTDKIASAASEVVFWGHFFLFWGSVSCPLLFFLWNKGTLFFFNLQNQNLIPDNFSPAVHSRLILSFSFYLGLLSWIIHGSFETCKAFLSHLRLLCSVKFAGNFGVL